MGLPMRLLPPPEVRQGERAFIHTGPGARCIHSCRARARAGASLTRSGTSGRRRACCRPWWMGDECACMMAMGDEWASMMAMGDEWAS